MQKQDKGDSICAAMSICTARTSAAFTTPTANWPCGSNLVEGGGFEPPKLSRQIYSLIPLATREPLQKERGILLVSTPDVNRNMVEFRQLAGRKDKLPKTGLKS